MNAQEQYISLFQEHRSLIDQYSAPLLNTQRERALAAFKTHGLPTLKDERYRYTDMQKLFAPDYGVNLQRVEFPVDPYKSFRCSVPNLSTQLYFLINDQFYDKTLPQTKLPQGVIVDSLLRVATKQPKLLTPYYAQLAKAEADPINALNTMLAQDGLLIYVPKGINVEHTIQIVNVLRSDVNLMVNRRILIILEQGASAKVLLCDHAADNRDFLSTQVTEAYVGENAHLELYDLEGTHHKNHRIANTYVSQEAHSTANLLSITMHNGQTRNLTDVALNGEHATITLNGCAVLDQKQIADNHTLIRHLVPNCQSNELYKYVLDGQSTGAFAGKVYVAKDAQKTISNEINGNLCATTEARMYTQPMLEIYADDVKCSHGSIVGQLNEQALFYMRQRGISEQEARTLLKYAFVAQVIDNIQLTSLRDRLHYLLEKRFRGELSRCEGCKLCN